MPFIYFPLVILTHFFYSNAAANHEGRRIFIRGHPPGKLLMLTPIKPNRKNGKEPFTYNGTLKAAALIFLRVILIESLIYTSIMNK
jgi:hypothetical protein